MTTLRRFRLGCRLACALALLLGAWRAEAAYDVFVKFGAPASGTDAYLGESDDPQFPGSSGWSRVISVGQGVLNPTTIGSASGGTATGRIAFAKISLVKLVDRGSPTLFSTCAEGGHYNAVQLVFREQGPVAPGTLPFSVAKLELVFITGIKTLGAAEDDRPTEQITLVYGTLQWMTRTVEPDGSVDSAVANWDVVLNDGGPGPLPGLTLSPASLTNGTVGTAYSQSFTTSGGTAPYTYQLQGGILPAGLTLSAAGLLAGTPTTAGSYPIQIAGVDKQASFDQRSYTVFITSDPCGLPPRLTGITATNALVQFRLVGTVGCQYQIQSAPDLSGPWSNLGDTVTLPGSGVFDFTDTNAPSQRFYRSLVAH